MGEGQLLLDTVEDNELLDPTLTTRNCCTAYHEDGVTVIPPAHHAHCTCSVKRLKPC